MVRGAIAFLVLAGCASGGAGLYRAGQQAQSNGQLEDARRAYEEAVAAEPANAQYRRALEDVTKSIVSDLVAKAKASEKDQDWLGASRSWQRAAEVDGAVSEYAVRRDLTLLKSRDLEPVEWYRGVAEILVRYPTDEIAQKTHEKAKGQAYRTEVANTKRELGLHHYRQAVIHLDRAKEIDPALPGLKAADVSRARALALIEEGDQLLTANNPVGAHERYQRAHELMPSAMIRRKLAQTKARAKEIISTLEAARKAAASGQTAKAVQLYAKLVRVPGAPPEAAVELEALERRLVESAVSEAKADVEAGRLDRAHQRLARALEDMDGDPEARATVRVGLDRIQRGEPAKGLQEMENVKLPKSADPVLDVINLFAFAVAKRKLGEALALAKKDPPKAKAILAELRPFGKDLADLAKLERELNVDAFVAELDRAVDAAKKGDDRTAAQILLESLDKSQAPDDIRDTLRQACDDVARGHFATAERTFAIVKERAPRSKIAAAGIEISRLRRSTSEQNAVAALERGDGQEARAVSILEASVGLEPESPFLEKGRKMLIGKITSDVSDVRAAELIGYAGRLSRLAPAAKAAITEGAKQLGSGEYQSSERAFAIAKERAPDADIAKTGFEVASIRNRTRSAKAEADKRRADEERLARDEAQRRAEAEKRKADEDAKRAEEERLRVEAEAKRKGEEDRMRAEAEKLRLEEEAKRRAEDERRRADAEKLRLEEEAKRKAEEDRLRAEAEKRRVEEEAKRLEAENTRKKAEEIQARLTKADTLEKNGQLAEALAIYQVLSKTDGAPKVDRRIAEVEGRIVDAAARKAEEAMAKGLNADAAQAISEGIAHAPIPDERKNAAREGVDAIGTGSPAPGLDRVEKAGLPKTLAAAAAKLAERVATQKLGEATRIAKQDPGRSRAILRELEPFAAALPGIRELEKQLDMDAFVAKLDRAVLSARAGNSQEAARVLRDALASTKAPEKLSSMITEGAAHLEARRFVEAEQSFVAAQRSAPESKIAGIAVEASRIMRRADDESAAGAVERGRGDVDAAVATLAASYDLEPSSPHRARAAKAIEKAMEKAKKLSDAEAAAMIDRIGKLTRNEDLEKGAAALKSQDSNAALAAFTSALAKDGSSAAAKIGLARARGSLAGAIAKGKVPIEDEATASLFGELLKRRPDDEGLQETLAKLVERIKRTQEPEKLGRALRIGAIASNATPVLRTKIDAGAQALAKGDVGLAEKELGQAVEIDPSSEVTRAAYDVTKALKTAEVVRRIVAEADAGRKDRAEKALGNQLDDGRKVMDVMLAEASRLAAAGQDREAARVLEVASFATAGPQQAAVVSGARLLAAQKYKDAEKAFSAQAEESEVAEAGAKIAFTRHIQKLLAGVRAFGELEDLDNGSKAAAEIFAIDPRDADVLAALKKVYGRIVTAADAKNAGEVRRLLSAVAFVIGRTDELREPLRMIEAGQKDQASERLRKIGIEFEEESEDEEVAERKAVVEFTKHARIALSKL